MASSSRQTRTDLLNNAPEQVTCIVNRQMGNDLSILDNPSAVANIVQQASGFSEENLSGGQPFQSNTTPSMAADKKLTSGKPDSVLD